MENGEWTHHSFPFVDFTSVVFLLCFSLGLLIVYFIAHQSSNRVFEQSIMRFLTGTSSGEHLSIADKLFYMAGITGAT